MDITEDIIRQAADGDINAFEQIYRAYSGFVYNVALRMLRHKQDAEEVTQEVFLTMHRKLDTFEFQSALKTWIYRMTVNLSINYSKKHARYTDKHIDTDDVAVAAGTKNIAEEIIERESREQVLDDMLRVLNEDQRAVLVLRAIQGLSYDDIARTLDININTVRTRLKRAREKLLALRIEVKAYEMP